MKKGFLIGVIFGLLVVPLSVLGFGNVIAEILFVPFVILPRTLLMMLIDVSTLAGLLSFGALVVISAVIYAILGAILGGLYKRVGLLVILFIIILFYLGFAFFGVARVSTAPDMNETTGDETRTRVVTCDVYRPDECPGECVVCPPCMACSSISCQTEEFCAEMGIDRSWYEGIQARVTNFQECIGAGNPAMESYPRQCRAGDQTFVEEVEVIE